MLDCVLASENQQIYRTVAGRLSRLEARTNLPVSLRLTSDIDPLRTRPTVFFVDRKAQAESGWIARRDYLRRYTGVIVITDKPMTTEECGHFWIHVDSTINVLCQQVVFDNAVLRAIRRRNAQFATETTAAEGRLANDLLFQVTQSP